MSDVAEDSDNQALQIRAAILPVSALPPGAPEPVLQGQTQASANASGFMNIEDMTLTAVPGNYNLSVSMGSDVSTSSGVGKECMTQHLIPCCCCIFACDAAMLLLLLTDISLRQAPAVCICSLQLLIMHPHYYVCNVAREQ